MAKAEVIELGAHSPSVESIASRLHRFSDTYESIMVLVEDKEGNYQFVCNEKPLADIVFEGEVIAQKIGKMVNNVLEGVDPHED